MVFISSVLYFFIKIYNSIWYNFPSVWRASFNITCGVVLSVVDFFPIFLCLEKSLFHSHLWMIFLLVIEFFLSFRFFGSVFFFFLIWYFMLLHSSCLYYFQWKMCCHLNFNRMPFFPMAAFKIFFFYHYFSVIWLWFVSV